MEKTMTEEKQPPWSSIKFEWWSWAQKPNCATSKLMCLIWFLITDDIHYW